MDRQLIVSPSFLVERLFEFANPKKEEHKKFIGEMIVGILGSKSTLVANVARFLDEEAPLKQTEKRLCRMLNNTRIDWPELRHRNLELNCRQVGQDDVIAFDPGDLIKKYARKMENLYRVHDGSTGECGNGYEDFSVEAIQWKDGKKTHIPLYHKLINAKCEDYVSQNRQICDAIHSIHECLGPNRGHWQFDRGHDRSRIFETLLSLKMWWTVRVCENRSVVPEDCRYQNPNKDDLGLMDMVKKIPLSTTPMQLTFPKKTGHLYLGWERVRLPFDSRKTPLAIVVVHDRRNLEPVVLLTNEPVASKAQAAVVFGYYLERWGKEEGYRFTKSFLNAENIRVLNWNSIQNLAFLTFLVYVFVALFYRGAPARIEAIAQDRLKHFRQMNTVRYKYHRIAQLMRLLLCEQTGRHRLLTGLTEVG